MEYGILTLIPIVVVIGMSLITKEFWNHSLLELLLLISLLMDLTLLQGGWMPSFGWRQTKITSGLY